MNTTGAKQYAFLGLGNMGRALAGAALAEGRGVTVWNRTPGKSAELEERGAVAAESLEDALRSSPVVVACLFDLASVEEQLFGHADLLRGRVLVNLTTTNPEESRKIGRWAAENGVRYLDGGIMATPGMIGREGSQILYSGEEAVFEEERDLLDLWGESRYFGSDAGLASLWDLAILAGMYVMYAGFFQGAAMVGSEGVKAVDFAAIAQPFLRSMTEFLPVQAQVIDSGSYEHGGQSLEFSDLGKMVRAADDQGVSPRAVQMVQDLLREQIDAGFGHEDFERIFEGFRGGNQ